MAAKMAVSFSQNENQLTRTESKKSIGTKKFLPWANEEEIKEEYRRLKLPIKAFYETIYLPRVPQGERIFGRDFFYNLLRVERRKVRIERTYTAKATETIQCFDISRELHESDCEPEKVNQVRITLVNGVSIDFYPGADSEGFVSNLLRQNGVRI